MGSAPCVSLFLYFNKVPLNEWEHADQTRLDGSGPLVPTHVGLFHRGEESATIPEISDE